LKAFEQENRIRVSLNKLVTELNKIDLEKLQNEHEDGRVNSITHEDRIIELIDNIAPNVYETPTSRNWFDISKSEDKDSLFFPINIKSSAFKSSDNVSSKKGLFYTLTGKLPSSDGWESFFKELATYINEDNRQDIYDYYFLVYNKETGEFFASSLKSIKKLTPNGSNLPFQVKWGIDNCFSSLPLFECEDDYINFNKIGSQYIFKVFKQSLEKKHSSYKTFTELNWGDLENE